MKNEFIPLECSYLLHLTLHWWAKAVIHRWWHPRGDQLHLPSCKMLNKVPLVTERGPTFFTCFQWPAQIPSLSSLPWSSESIAFASITSPCNHCVAHSILYTVIVAREWITSLSLWLHLVHFSSPALTVSVQTKYKINVNWQKSKRH